MLSGGQRQRIAIARAFIRETPILILDEPTTGLDLESTQLVLTALRSLMRGKTTIIISHDLGLIRCADRILVIADGRIAESGAARGTDQCAGSLRGALRKRTRCVEDAAAPVATANVSPVTEGRNGDWTIRLRDRCANASYVGAPVGTSQRTVSNRRPMSDPVDRRVANVSTSEPMSRRVRRFRSSAASASREDARPDERLESRTHGSPHRADTAPSPAARSTWSPRVRSGISPTAHAHSVIGWPSRSGHAEVSEHTVLARVYPSDEVAGRSPRERRSSVGARGRPAGSLAAVDNHAATVRSGALPLPRRSCPPDACGGHEPGCPSG